ncbi:MAG: hypothetical protein K1565_20810, partial [Candidatus Thiodiazotropha sp. (ex. Lucinisca nassula)]|nr:hypothetical protein [Candidatus Thiodiazotropha sp. (ex. Lucinisca nassula)]
IDIEALGGDNTINLDPLSDGIYSNCSITLTDPAGNSSDPLTIPTFTIDTTPPVLTEVQAISTPTSNNTPVYSFQSTESGTISYSGACSSTSLSANEGMNTINLGPLVDSTYSNCEINLTDQAGNISTGLTLSSFTIDTTVPQMLNAVVYEGSNANRIALSVSEAVTGVNGSSELSVTVNGQATSILSVEKHPVDSTKIWITLTRRVYAGEAITIIHTASGMIKDEAGNQLTDGQIAVTNSTTTPVDPTPEMQSAVVYEGLIFPTKSRHRIKHASAGTPAHTH